VLLQAYLSLLDIYTVSSSCLALPAPTFATLMPAPSVLFMATCLASAVRGPESLLLMSSVPLSSTTCAHTFCAAVLASSTVPWPTITAPAPRGSVPGHSTISHGVGQGRDVGKRRDAAQTALCLKSRLLAQRGFSMKLARVGLRVNDLCIPAVLDLLGSSRSPQAHQQPEVRLVCLHFSAKNSGDLREGRWHSNLLLLQLQHGHGSHLLGRCRYL